MNTPQNSSFQHAFLNARDKQKLDALLHPAYILLLGATIIFVGGALMTASALNGIIPATLASSAWGWNAVWVSGITGVVGLLGMFSAKPLALKAILHGRARNS